MTSLEYTAEALEVTLGAGLVIRLLNLRLHLVYRLFSFFLVIDVLGSVIWGAQHFMGDTLMGLDYRLLWVAQRCLVFPLLVMTVYTLLGAVLKSLPGILNFSRRFMNWAFLMAFAIGLLSAAWESKHSGLSSHQSWQDRVLFIGLLADRAVSTVVLLAILSILSFLLWFPVQIPRNLAVFIVGFAVYSAGISTGLLFQSLVVHNTSRWISTAIELLASACFAYWGLFITQAGESAPAQLNVRRDHRDQDRLMRTLESLNEALLKGARR